MGIMLPLILVNDEHSSPKFSVNKLGSVEIANVMELGETGTLVRTYKVLVALRLLGAWIRGLCFDARVGGGMDGLLDFFFSVGIVLLQDTVQFSSILDFLLFCTL